MNLEKEVFEIHLEDLVPNRFQPREKFDDQSLEELAQSIREHGVIQPIIVRKIGDKYEIIAGERRYRASVLAEQKTIPALIRNIDDKETAKIALLENLQRKNLTAIEEARTYETILKLDNLTQEELAKNLGKSQSTIANKLRLLNLDKEVQNALLEEKISERHARSLLNLEDKEQQKSMLETVILNRMTVKQLDDAVATMTGKVVQTEDVIEELSTKPIGSNLMDKEYANAIFESTPEKTQEKTEVSQEKAYSDITPISIEKATEEILSKNAFDQFSIPKSPIFEQKKLEKNEENPLIIDSASKADNSIDFSLPKSDIEIPSYASPKIEIEIPNEEKAFTSYDEIEKMVDNIHNKSEMENLANKEEPNNFATYDEIEKMLNANKPIGEQTLEKQEKTIPSNDIYDMRFAINNFRQAVQNTQKFGFKIEVEEFDFENAYQIIIKIDKKK